LPTSVPRSCALPRLRRQSVWLGRCRGGTSEGLLRRPDELDIALEQLVDELAYGIAQKERANASSGAVTVNRYDEYGVPSANNAGRFQYTGQAGIPELGLYHYKRGSTMRGLGGSCRRIRSETRMTSICMRMWAMIR
jgi:hypothetical protein